MPLFEYQCPEGHKFDKLIRSGEAPYRAKCEECLLKKDKVRPAYLQIAAPSPFVWGRGGGV